MYAIEINELSKAYRIGLREEIPDTLFGAVQSLAAAPWRNWQRLRRLNTFGKADNESDTLWALERVTAQIEPGEVVGIIGRNGAGKSTLLKVLSRITEPTSGRALIRGRVSSLLEVGTGFHPELTGRENVYMNGTILGMTRREIKQKFDAIVEFSGVDRFLDTPVKRYSSGMKVRLAFAVAAHLEPEILIIDEVLAVGDAAFQQKCLGKMRDVSGSGRTVLFVSHNTGAVTSLCRRGILLDHGKIVADGPVRPVIAEYLSRLATNKLDVVTDPRLPVQIQNVACLDAEFGPAAQIAFGESLVIAVTCSGEMGHKFSIGIRVVNLQGIVVYDLLSSDEVPLIELTKDSTVWHAVLPEIGLNEGPHYVSVLLRDEFGVRRTIAENCAQFSVVSPHTGAIRSKGCVRLKAEWFRDGD